MRCWNCRRPSGYREQVLKAIGGLAIALANDGKLEEAQQELDTLQKKGASSGDRDLVAAEILSLTKVTMIRHLHFTQKCSMRWRTRSS